MSRELSYIKPSVRSVNPPLLRDPVRLTLSSGIPVYIIDSGTEEIERVDFSFRAGSIVEKTPLTASTACMMLTEGTENLKATEINSLLDSECVYYHPYSERDRAGITTCFLNKHIENILEVSRDIIFYPAFPLPELKLMMEKRLRAFLIDRERVHTLAADKFFESIFGADHPYGRCEVPEDFNGLTRRNLLDFHARYYRPENLTIIISGKIPSNIEILLNRYFGDLKFRDIPKEERLTAIEPLNTKKAYIGKKGALQSAIRIGSSTINKRHEDYHGLKIANTILGGYFGSRLMKNIREEKGYTYGISSSVISFVESGFFSISTEVSNKFTRNAVDEIYREIRRLQSEPVGKDELTVVKNFMLGDLVRMFDGPFALGECFRAVWEFGLDNSYYQKFTQKIKTISADEIMELALKYFKIDDLFEIIAG